MRNRALMGLMLLVASALLAGMHYFVWARLVRDTGIPSPLFEGITAGLVLLALGAPILRITARRNSALERALGTPLFIWLGGLFLTASVLAILDVGRAVLGLVAPAAVPDARTFALLSLGLVVVLIALSLVNVARGPHVKTVEVTLPGLPPEMDGTTLAQWTDVHIGPSVQRPHVEKMVEMTNALGADAVVITGDLVDGPVSEHRDDVQPLAQLRAKHGVYFVTGNHEYYRGVEGWLNVLRSVGVRALRNERVAIGGLDLVGVDDFNARGFGNGHGADLPRALDGRDAARPAVLLAHQPRAVVEAEALGVALQLSGHTHAGQIWPWNYFVRLQQPYVAGLIQHGRTQLYISAGTGFWGPPMRLGSRAEITRVVLRAPA